jgi:hypothetical protein
MELKDIDERTILSSAALIAGILMYLGWGITYGVWWDIGIYSITIFLVLLGLLGMLLSRHTLKEE